MQNFRLCKADRRNATIEAVGKEGRALGRGGWVTMRMVAHSTGLVPSNYVMKILHGLVTTGRLHRKVYTSASGRRTYKFRHPANASVQMERPF